MIRFALVVLTALMLAGCNTDGFDELPPRGGAGNGTIIIPSKPNTGSSTGNWAYHTVSNDSGIFDATATVYPLLP